MKFLSTLFAALPIVLFSFSKAEAKDYTISSQHKFSYKDTSEDAKTGALITVTNNSGKSINIFYKIIKNSFDSTGWTYSVCNPEQCHYSPDIPDSESITLGTAPFNQGPFDVGVTSFNGKLKQGEIKIIFYELGFANQPDTLDVTIDATKVGISESQQAANMLNVYPNPAQNLIYVSSANGSYKPTQATIYNMAGQKMAMQEFTLSATNTVDIATLPKGVYVVQMQDKNGLMANKMITKE
jgi:hypothetical protein